VLKETLRALTWSEVRQFEVVFGRGIPAFAHFLVKIIHVRITLKILSQHDQRMLIHIGRDRS
jgi:hypothetical protein